MRRTCPDCDVGLVWIQILDQPLVAEKSLSLEYIDIGAVTGSGPKSIRGTIEAGRCPQCERVLLYAWPKGRRADGGLTRSSVDRVKEHPLYQKLEDAAQRGTRGARELQEIVLHRPYGDVFRSEALRRLAGIVDGERLFEVIASAMVDESKKTRLTAMAVKMIANLDDALPLDLADDLFKRSQPKGQLEIMNLLQRTNPDAAKSALVTWLADPNTGLQVVCTSIERLANLGGAEGFAEVLVELLRHAHPDVVGNAIVALGMVGGEQHLAELESFTQGFFRSADLKSAAKLAIERIKESMDQSAKGGLSIHEEVASGQLTFSDAEGRLSPAEAED